MLENFAVIGFGYWGPNWARTIEDNPLTKLKAIVDYSDLRLEKAKSLYPETQLFKDFSELTSLNIDVAVLATPPGGRVELTRALAQMGIPVLIIEKPIALSLDESLRIYEIANNFGMKIVVDYPYLYSQAVRSIKDLLIQSPRVEYVESQRHNLGIFRPDMNVIWDLSVHDLSIFDYLFGPLLEIEVSCSTTNSLGSPHPSSGLVQIRGKNIPQLVSSVSWISPAKIRRFVTHSPRRMISWDDTSQSNPVNVYETDMSFDEQALMHYRIGNSFSPQLKHIPPLGTLLSELTLSSFNFDFEEDRDRTLRITKALELAAESQKSESRYVPSGNRG